MTTSTIKLFLSGDVMTGRGIDQILPHPGDPRLFESYMRSARGYVALAEGVAGAIPRKADFAYIWGDALALLERERPAARIVNLETAVTTADEAWPGKGIHYRMHPDNLPCLTAARIDCCVLANNHTLDWGWRGLEETLASLRAAGLLSAGAGAEAAAAALPAVIELGQETRLLVFAYALPDSGVPREWAAAPGRAGLNVLPGLSTAALDTVVSQVRALRRPRDIAIVSLHWGGNWGYYIDAAVRAFAHGLIDAGAADLVHGHSSHHALGIEVYREHLILYGCGDLLNDYEGIEGHADYRPGLALMYLPQLDRISGRLRQLDLIALRSRAFRLAEANAQDTAWLAATLSREGHSLGTSLVPAGAAHLRLRWN